MAVSSAAVCDVPTGDAFDTLTSIDFCHRIRRPCCPGSECRMYGVEHKKQCKEPKKKPPTEDETVPEADNNVKRDINKEDLADAGNPWCSDGEYSIS